MLSPRRGEFDSSPARLVQLVELLLDGTHLSPPAAVCTATWGAVATREFLRQLSSVGIKCQYQANTVNESKAIAKESGSVVLQSTLAGPAMLQR